MKSRKTYGQFCGLARALDRVGDRWTLLVVRELLLGPRTYRAISQALRGMSPNLLTHRLQVLTDSRLVERSDAPARSKAVTFRLTNAGEALEPVVLEFIRWGARWMIDGPGSDTVDSRWAVLALRALLDGAATREQQDGVVHIDAAGATLTIRVSEGVRSVHAGYLGAADASITGSLAALLAAACGIRRASAADLQIEGDAPLARAVLLPG